MALLHAINYDRRKKGLPSIALVALDVTSLARVPEVDWRMPVQDHYLAFEKGAP